MPFTAVPNGAKVEHLATIYNRPIANVLGGILAEPITQSDLDAFAIAAANAWDTNMVAFAESAYVYLGCRVTLLATATDLQSYHPMSSVGAGTSDTRMPPSLAGCVTLRTGERSRRGRGRMYWPIIRQAGVTEAETFTLNPTFRTGLQTNFQAYLTALGSTVLPPAVVSRKDGLARAITSISVDSRVDHQRRRDG